MSGSARRLQQSQLSYTQPAVSGGRLRAMLAVVRCAGLMPPSRVPTFLRRKLDSRVECICQLGRFVSWMLGRLQRRPKRSHLRVLIGKRKAGSGRSSGREDGAMRAAGYGRRLSAESSTYLESSTTRAQSSMRIGYGAMEAHVAFAHAQVRVRVRVRVRS